MDFNADKFNDVVTKGLTSWGELEKEQKNQRLKMAQQAYERVTDQRDFYLQMAGNKEFPDYVRKDAYNTAAALAKKVNPDSPLKPMDSWDPTADGATKSIAYLMKQKADGEIDDSAFANGLNMVMTSAMANSQSKSSTDNVMDVISKIKGQPRTVTMNGQDVQGTEGLGGFQPTMVQGQPAVTDNMAEKNFQLEQDKFADSQKPKPISGEVAGKVAAAQTGLKDLAEIESIALSKDGKNLGPILAAKAGIPTEEGSRLDAANTRVVEAVARILSGAGLKDEEIRNFAKQYKINPTDPVSTAKEKIMRAKDFMTNFIYMNDPQGKLQLTQPKSSASQTPAQKLTPQDQQAINWAKKNPKDPRAVKILQLHGM